jgi:Domain of unknown function (DUF4864)
MFFTSVKNRVLYPLLLWCLLWMTCLPGVAQTMNEVDRTAIRTVIQNQLTAFQKDDANRAFSFASPGIQQVFGTAQNFLAMVKNTYPAVYRPRSVIFDRLTSVEGTPVQTVLLLAPNGDLMRALYEMEQQRNGSWRIRGCVLIQAEGSTT